MRIIIDADGCPVVDITVRTAKDNNIECIIVCDTSHIFDRYAVKTVTVSKGADSADFAVVNMVLAGDIVVTQDYGLAAMCLARGAFVIDQNGMEFNSHNIDALLLSRHTAKKIRMAGGRIKGPKKRERRQDEAFERKLAELILKH